VMSFEPTQPIKLLDTDEFTDWFLVKGIMTSYSVENGRRELISQMPMAAKVVMEYQAGSEDKVATLIELHPAEADSKSSPQGDLVTQASGAVNDVAKKSGLSF
jgi:hypothetical protein